MSAVWEAEAQRFTPPTTSLTPPPFHPPLQYLEMLGVSRSQLVTYNASKVYCAGTAGAVVQGP